MEQASAAHAHGVSPERGRVVMFTIVLAAAMFVAMVAVTYYRWSTVSEPTSANVIDAGPELDGAIIHVEGIGMRRPQQVTLSSENNFSTPIYVHPGSYTLRITQADRLLYQRQFELSSRQGIRLDLKDEAVQASPVRTR